ncbi:MAG TPA: S8 family serine peptidase [Bryobacterales bacterium]|nr:S8 family serine peptidase [Bryobacterales bacterium]
MRYSRRFSPKASGPDWLALVARVFVCVAIFAWSPAVGSAQVQVPVEFGPDGSIVTPAPLETTPGATSIPGRYIVKFANGASPAARAAAAREIGAQVRHNFAFSSTIAITVPNDNALNALRTSRSVLWIVPDQLLAFAAPPGVRAPENLSASVSGSDVTLTWTQRGKVDSYTVERCASAGCSNFSAIASNLPQDPKTYTDPGLADGIYRYRVIAFDAGASSPPSGIAEATVSAEPPPPPPPPPSDGAVRGTQQVLTYEVQRVGRPVEGSTGLGIGVAVVDSGIDFLHTDLSPAPDAAGTVNPDTNTSTGTSFNADSPGTSCQDAYSHGTHVAGLIGALDNNGGMVGVAPEATLYCVKIDLTETPGAIPLSNLQAGLEWVLASHNRVVPNIKVVNLSLATPPPPDGVTDPAREEIANLIQQLYAAGVITVASAGNDPTKDVSEMFPANVANVISVAGTTATIGLNTCTDTLGWVLADTVYAGGNGSPGTTDGTGVTISAPAEERHDLLPGGSVCNAFLYGTLSTSLTTTGGGPPGVTDLITRKLPTPGGPFEARGTSFSAGLVSGVMARIYQAALDAGNLNGTSGDVDGARFALLDGADRVGTAPLDHPWAGVLVVQSPDGVQEGIAQAPMPAAVP